MGEPVQHRANSIQHYIDGGVPVAVAAAAAVFGSGSGGGG